MAYIPKNLLALLLVLLVIASGFILIKFELLPLPEAFIKSTVDTALFVPTTELESFSKPNELTTIRFRQVGIRFELLEKATIGQTITLNLFEDRTVTFVVADVVLDRFGYLSLIGAIEGEEYSTVTFVTKDGIVSADIGLIGESYSIRFIGNKNHLVIENSLNATSDH